MLQAHCNHLLTRADEAEFADVAELLTEMASLLFWMGEVGGLYVDLLVFDTTDARAFAENPYTQIWAVLRRLCRWALDSPSLQHYEEGELTVAHILRRYAGAAPPSVSPEDYYARHLQDLAQMQRSRKPQSAYLHLPRPVGGAPVPFTHGVGWGGAAESNARGMAQRKALEVKSLLRFFAQAREDKWAQIPEWGAPVRIDVGEVPGATDRPLLVLALTLSSHLRSCPEEFADEAELMADIRGVLIWLHDLGTEDDFEYDEDEGRVIVESYVPLWSVLRRLCSLALECPSVRRYDGAALSVQYFVETYTYPLSQEELSQWSQRQ